MQESVNYDELMSALGTLNMIIASEKAEIKTACASISIKLNEVGFQGLATSTIDTSFASMNNYFDQASEYIRELITIVNKTVIGEYQTADNYIKEIFQQALDGTYTVNSYNGYNAGDYLYGASSPRQNEASDWLNKVQNYGNNQ